MDILIYCHILDEQAVGDHVLERSFGIVVNLMHFCGALMTSNCEIFNLFLAPIQFSFLSDRMQPL